MLVTIFKLLFAFYALVHQYEGKNVVEKMKPWRDLACFPIVYNVVGFAVISILYVVSPGYLIEPEKMNLALYFGVVTTHWSLFYVIIRRLGTSGVKKLTVPKKETRWLPSIFVFVSLNMLFTGYMMLALIFDRIPPWGHVDAPQFIFYVVINSVTAGFVEELIWRGYFIEKLLASRKTEWKAIVYSSVSFAFIHGVIVIDKLAVTFLFGLIAGAYYVKERNLPVLMATHVIVDVIAFWLSLFRPI